MAQPKIEGPDVPDSTTSPDEKTPIVSTAPATPDERPSQRLPSLRSVSDSPAGSRSSIRGTLNSARHPTPTAGNLPTDILDKVRAFQNARMAMSSATNPASPINRPASPKFTPEPVVPKPSGRRRPPPGKLPTQHLAGFGKNGHPVLNGPPRQSNPLDDFKQYIDTEKGWITFQDVATITKSGVNFANGQTFSISLDEIEVLEELGKGNYGTVYKVRHAKPALPRFGQGLSAFKGKGNQQTSLQSSPAGSTVSSSASTPGGVVPGGAEKKGTTGKVMAMKEIRLELDEAKFKTILKELVILHECVSPYIIEFYGAFYQEGAVYMCIEYMDGGSIDKLYAGGIPEPVLRNVTYCTVMGLKSLKDEHNIIHRDVKPTNILVNSQGQVKICDFGVSGNLVASIAKTNIGCQSYMAPERISGSGPIQGGANAEGTYSVQSDIWSLGLTIIECAMGRYPYPPEVSSTIFSQLTAIVNGEPPDMPDNYSATAHDFVRSCLFKNPLKRHTYSMLLKHPWLKPFSEKDTIVEVDSDSSSDSAKPEDAVVAAVTDGLDGISLNKATAKTVEDGEADTSSVAGDAEVAAWVKKALEKTHEQKEESATTANVSARPALHAAPLAP